MWNNSGNWNMWAMQPAAYNNIPSDQVDWASLAKQWIANREMLGVPQPVTAAAPPPPLLPPVKPMPSMGRLGDMPAVVGGNMMAQTQPQTIVCDMENSNSQDSSYFQAGGESEQGTSDGWNKWNQNMPAWAVPPPPPPVEESQNFNRGNAAGSEMPYGGNSGQYMTSPFSFNQSTEEMYSGPYEHAGFQQFWGQGPMVPHQMVPEKAFGPVHDTMEYRAPPKRGNRNWPPMNDVPPLLDESGIDAAKRRQLPLWIREGLEKMEREKQRQMEKEQHELAMQNAKKAREEAENDNTEGKVEITGPIKSIFDSDDEEKPGDAYDAHQSPPHSEPQKQHVITEQKKSLPSEDEEEEEEDDVPVSDEERQARMMLKVRQMLTEVLLEVTNREIEDVAHSFYSHAKRKQALAPARQLAKSTALASITSLGLGYGSESSADEADDRASSDNAEESDDEAALQERIRRKKADFEQKMREAEEKERTKEMEMSKHVEEQSKPQKHAKTSGDPSITVRVENEDDGRTGQESEAVRTRSKADHGSKAECLDEKKQSGEEVSRTKVAANKQANKSRKVVEVEESSESDSDSNSDNSSSSESDSSEGSSSETSESEKGIKNVTKNRPKSQTSLPDEVPRDKGRDQNRRRNEEETRAVRQESSSRSRKEADRKKLEAKEEERRLSKKKRTRNSSDGDGEGLGQGEKRRHISQSDDKYSRHRLEEPRTASRQTERTDDKDRSRRHKDSSQTHKKFSQKQDERAKSDDSDRHDASYDYLSRTCEQDYERPAKPRHKRSKHSQSSHSSTERPSRHRRERTPDRRRSTHGQVSSSGKDRGRHKSANNRSGKKERAKRRSRSRSRSES